MTAPHRPLLALGLRLLAMAMLSISLLFSKLSGQRGIALTETMFWRQLLPALAIFGWLTVRGEAARLRTGRFWIHVRRAIIGTLSMFLTLGVVQIIPLAESTILGFTTPLFAVLLARVVLRETVGPWRWGAVLLGLAGILVIFGPGHDRLPPAGAAVGLAAALFVALVSIQLRDLGRTEEPIRVVFYFSALGALMLLPGALLTGHTHDRGDWTVLIGIGLSGLLTQLFITASLRFGTVSSVLVMDYSQIIWSTLWGALFFAQLPPATTWLGAPLIIAAGLVVIWRERLRNQRTAIDPLLAPNVD